MFFLRPYLVSATCFVLIWRLWVYMKDRKANPRRLPNPPGPKGYPIIGNLLDIPLKKPWLQYEKWIETHGDMVYFKAFGQGFLILGSLRRTNDLLDKRSTNYSDRPRLVVMSELMGLDYNVAFMPYGSSWRRHRRTSHQHFNTKAVSKYQPVQVTEARAFLRRLLDTPERFLEHTRLLFVALAMKTVYDITVNSLDDPYVHVLEEVVLGASEAAVPGKYLAEIIPIMKHIPSWFPGAGWQKKMEYYKRLNHRLSHEPYNFVKDNLRKGIPTQSIAATLIEESRQENLAEAEEIAINVTATSLIAGADTTISNVQSFLLAMCLNPEVQRKAQQELDSVIGDRLPDFNDRGSLPYINAVVKECTRWQPVSPLSLPHMVTHDDEYEGYFIPKGTIVFGAIWTILHDPEVYDEPMRFMPERFLKDGQPDPEVVDPSTAAFGFGRRVCPGKDMSKNSLFIIIASVLAVYDIKPALDEHGNLVSMSPDYCDDFVQFPLPFKARFLPRSERAKTLIRNTELLGGR